MLDFFAPDSLLQRRQGQLNYMFLTFLTYSSIFATRETKSLLAICSIFAFHEVAIACLKSILAFRVFEVFVLDSPFVVASRSP